MLDKLSFSLVAMMNFLKSYSHFSNILYKDFPRVSYLSNMKGIFNVKFIGKQYIKAKQFQLKFSFYFRFLGKTKSKHVEDRPSRFNQKSGEWTLSEMPKPVAHRCRKNIFET